ncbi:DsbA family protein [Bartonella sp. DGB1]|uniref:DsbA family protein n=1 Tax=Bartonella sp. DGB1 TaxID=3239807 RepID=UPI00352496D5
MKIKIGKIVGCLIVALGLLGIYSPINVLAYTKPHSTVNMDKLINQPNILPDMVKGQVNAPVTIIEYGSLTCSYCGVFFLSVYPQIQKKYIDTGKVKLIFREFPLDPFSTAASMVARCAAPKDYFSVIDTFFTNQQQWLTAGPEQARDYIFRVAAKYGLDKQKTLSCFDNKDILDKLKNGLTVAYEQFKIDAAPTFVINGDLYKGALNFAEISEIIDAHLAKVRH